MSPANKQDAKDAADHEIMRRLRERYKGIQISFQMTDAVWRSTEELDMHIAHLIGRDGAVEALCRTVTSNLDWRVSGGGEAFQPVAEMAKAYATPSSRYFREASLLDMIRALLDHLAVFVHDGCEKPGNWWAWDIGIPMRLGDMLIHVGDDLSEGCRQQWLAALAYLNPDILVRPPDPQSGANGLWITFNNFKYGLVTEDPRYIKAARDVMATICRISETEGIQTDYSYHFHGPGLNMGYGGDQLFDVSRYVYVTAGTPFALPAAALDTHLRWVTDFVIWNMRGGGQNPYSMGRAGTRGDTGHSSLRMHMSAIVYLTAAGVDSEGRLAGYLKEWVDRFGLDDLPLEVRPLLSEILRSAAEPCFPIGVRYYPRSDYLAIQRDHYAAWIRMHGRKRLNWFSIHHENRKGWYAGDGTLVIMQTGCEYKDGVLATQDWERLPGITRAVDDRYKRPQGKLGQSELVAGVSLASETGACAFDFVVQPEVGQPLRARKSWFALPDGSIVAVGSGITLDEEIAVETVVDQRPIDDTEYIHLEGQQYAVADGLTQDTAASWLHAGSTGYVMLQRGVKVCVEERTGRFGGITGYQPHGTTLEHEYRHRTFIAVVEHHTCCHNGSYAVVYLPGSSPERTRQYALRPRAQLLRHDQEAHIIRDEQSALVAAACFAPVGTQWLRSDTPGLVLYQVQGHRLALAVSLQGHQQASGVGTIWIPQTLDLKRARAYPAVAAAHHDAGGTTLRIEWQEEKSLEMVVELGE